jgi:3-oxoacyl-[acyl-carrier protein] reductase
MRASTEEDQMEQSLKGKTALVTGASRGIGRAIAERLAKDGATVALTYNASKSGADEAVAAIEKAGGAAFAIHADLVDPATVPTLFERLDDEFTKRNGSKALDILVNNAGNSGWVSFKDATPDSWDTLIAVYASAPFFIVQAALDRLADGGRIINISSAAATKPVTAAPAYSMAKAAINNLTHALASELAARNYRERRSAGLHANGRERRLPRESRTRRGGRGRNRAGTLRRAFGNRRRGGVLGFR